MEPSPEFKRKQEDLQRLLLGLGVPQRRDFSFSYPSDGTRKALPVGTTVLDFLRGEVRLPDGSVDKMLDSLDAHGRRYVRSMLIEVDRPVVINVDGARVPLDPGVTVFRFIEFQKLRVTTTASTKFNVWANTNPLAEFVKEDSVVTVTEVQVINEQQLRDTSAVDSDVASTKYYSRMTIIVRNDLDKPVKIQVKGNRTDSTSNAYDIGLPVDVEANSVDYFPVEELHFYVFVQATPLVAPTTGSLSVWIQMDRT